MEAIFDFTPTEAYSIKDNLWNLLKQKDFQDYIQSNIDKKLNIVISPAESLPEKERLYRYYHKVILNVAISVFTNDGWEGVDKVKADYLLKAECAKEVMYNSKTNSEDIYLLDKASMNKDRLRKFISDCINYLEIERGARVPDSAAYLTEINTGISGFTRIKR